MRRLKLFESISDNTDVPDPVSASHSRKRKASIGIEDGVPQASSIRSVSLGSRKQLCINDDLRKRTNDLDESCRQLLNGKWVIVSECKLLTLFCVEKGDRRCKYLPPAGEDTVVHELRDQILERSYR
jgi:chromosome transmission fidelity protein 1